MAKSDRSLHSSRINNFNIQLATFDTLTILNDWSYGCFDVATHAFPKQISPYIVIYTVISATRSYVPNLHPASAH